MHVELAIIVPYATARLKPPRSGSPQLALAWRAALEATGQSSIAPKREAMPEGTPFIWASRATASCGRERLPGDFAGLNGTGFAVAVQSFVEFGTVSPCGKMGLDVGRLFAIYYFPFRVAPKKGRLTKRSLKLSPIWIGFRYGV